MTTESDYPPLAPLDTMPLHSGRVDFAEPGWFGCEFPERPADGDVLWDWRCHGCVVHAAASLHNQGDRPMVWYPRPGAEPQRKTLAWHVARAEFWAMS